MYRLWVLYAVIMMVSHTVFLGFSQYGPAHSTLAVVIFVCFGLCCFLRLSFHNLLDYPISFSWIAYGALLGVCLLDWKLFGVDGWYYSYVDMRHWVYHTPIIEGAVNHSGDAVAKWMYDNGMLTPIFFLPVLSYFVMDSFIVLWLTRYEIPVILSGYAREALVAIFLLGATTLEVYWIGSKGVGGVLLLLLFNAILAFVLLEAGKIVYGRWLVRHIQMPSDGGDIDHNAVSRTVWQRGQGVSWKITSDIMRERMEAMSERLAAEENFMHRVMGYKRARDAKENPHGTGRY